VNVSVSPCVSEYSYSSSYFLPLPFDMPNQKSGRNCDFRARASVASPISPKVPGFFFSGLRNSDRIRGPPNPFASFFLSDVRPLEDHSGVPFLLPSRRDTDRSTLRYANRRDVAAKSTVDLSDLNAVRAWWRDKSINTLEWHVDHELAESLRPRSRNNENRSPRIGRNSCPYPRALILS